MILLFINMLMSLNFSISNFDLDKTGEFQKGAFVSNSDTLNYQILLPIGFDSKKEYPLVLFLHGSGERGYDNEAQLTHGGDLFTQKSNLVDFPCIALFPQCPPNEMWTNRKKEQGANGPIFSFDVERPLPKSSQLVNQLVDTLSKANYVDASRLYIMGISMGGMGTLEQLYRYPDKYAAAVVICGGHDKTLANKYAQTPIWFFHGGVDDVVPPYLSKDIYDIVKKSNRKSKYTLYRNDNHNSWDSALAEPKLLEWIFKYKSN